MPIDPTKWLDAIDGADEALDREAQLALGGLGPDDDVVMQPIFDALSSPSEKRVFWAVAALTQLEGRSLPALPRVAELATGDAAFGVRQAAVGALAKIAPGEATARNALRRALADESPFVRRQALQAFVAVPSHTSEELAAIDARRDDPDSAVRASFEIARRHIRLRN